jgi:cysteine desulfurase
MGRGDARTRPPADLGGYALTVYLDCNATTPIEPEVRDIVLRYMVDEYGNAGSRTHEFGARAQQAVQRARDQVAALVDAKREEVIFTSGATEANNLAILGLAPHGEKSGRRHIITSAIEHKSVLEPVEALRARGFAVTVLPVTSSGWVDPATVRSALRADTLLVSIMHANNETGVLQPIIAIAEDLSGHEAFFHVDAAQGFGKDLGPLKSMRIDLISISGHKLYAPKGVGALIARRRGYDRVPLRPLIYGGGQERGLRSGTLPVPLVAGLGLAAELAVRDRLSRREVVGTIRDAALRELTALQPVMHGDTNIVQPHVLNIAFPPVDSEAIVIALKDLAAVSNGSACTSQHYRPSHVLRAMGISADSLRGAVRISWSHLTGEIDWPAIRTAIGRLQ